MTGQCGNPAHYYKHEEIDPERASRADSRRNRARSSSPTRSSASMGAGRTARFPVPGVHVDRDEGMAA